MGSPLNTMAKKINDTKFDPKGDEKIFNLQDQGLTAAPLYPGKKLKTDLSPAEVDSNDLKDGGVIQTPNIPKKYLVKGKEA